MTNKKRINLGYTISLIFCLLLINSGNLSAQPDPGTGPICWPPPCIPIDGGIGFLIAAGIAFGVKKTMDLKFKQKDSAADEKSTQPGNKR